VHRQVGDLVQEGRAGIGSQVCDNGYTDRVQHWGEDPVAVGLVTSFNRPGATVTGISWLRPK